MSLSHAERSSHSLSGTAINASRRDPKLLTMFGVGRSATVVVWAGCRTNADISVGAESLLVPTETAVSDACRVVVGVWYW